MTKGHSEQLAFKHSFFRTLLPRELQRLASTRIGVEGQHSSRKSLGKGEDSKDTYIGSRHGRSAGDSDEESDNDGRDVGEVHVAKVGQVKV